MLEIAFELESGKQTAASNVKNFQLFFLFVGNVKIVINLIKMSPFLDK